jgi:lipid-binding SYLF domain-containing protein
MKSYIGHWAVFAAGLSLAVIAVPHRVVAQETDYDLEKKKLEVAQAIEGIVQDDPGMQRFFDDSYAYAVFPSVGKAGFVVGGAHGNGLVYQQGNLVGASTLKQLDIGLQMGGQSYIQVMFFQGKEDLDRFRANKLEFSGQASAVAITAGASADIDYAKGVAVISKTKGGLMYEATLGGQTFEYKPIGY